MIKAYSYVRFSSFRQASGDSVRRQTEMARTYAEENNLELQDLSLRDMGVSAFRGTNATDGALAEFTRLVDEGEIPEGSFLLVENFDRLSREVTRVALSRLLSLIDLGIVVVTLSDGQVYKADSLDDMQLMMSILYMARANDESVQKSRRTKAVWENRKQQARENGSIIANSNYPRWLKKHEGTLVEIPEHVEVVQQVFRWARDGLGYQKIAQQLNQQGSFTFHKAVQWRDGNIQSMLRNRAVLGEYQPHQIVDGDRIVDGDAIQEYYPKIIEPSLFLQVQNAIDSRNKRGSGYRRGSFANLFIGLMKCTCGSSMILGSQRSSNNSSYLKCSAYSACESTGGIRYQYVEPQILIALSHIGGITSRFQHRDNNELSGCALELTAKQKRLDEMLVIFEESPSANVGRMIASLEVEIAVLVEKQHGLELEESERQLRQSILLNTESLETPEERSAFNAKLRLLLDYIEVIDQEGDKTLVYFVKTGSEADSQAVLNQELIRGSRCLKSDIYEMDGTLVCKTQSTQPYIRPMEEEAAPLEGYPAIESTD